MTKILDNRFYFLFTFQNIVGMTDSFIALAEGVEPLNPLKHIFLFTYELTV